EFAVVFAIRRVEPLEDLHDLSLGWTKVEPFKHAGNVGRIRLAINIEQQAPDGSGLRRGNFLDIHTAFSRKQDQGPSRHNVVNNGGIEFARNFGLLFVKQGFDERGAGTPSGDLLV